MPIHDLGGSMIQLPWGNDQCPHCTAVTVPCWWKLRSESRTCPACDGGIELSEISRNIRDGISIGLGIVSLPVGIYLLANFDGRSLAVVAATLAAVAWFLTWLPSTASRGAATPLPESVSAPAPRPAIGHLVTVIALASLAAGLLIAATSFELDGQRLILIFLGVGIAVGLFTGLMFDLPLGVAIDLGDRLLGRLSFPTRSWARKLLRGAMRLVVTAALLIAVLEAVALFD